MSSDDDAIALTSDHTTFNKEEIKRVESVNGWVKYCISFDSSS